LIIGEQPAVPELPARDAQKPVPPGISSIHRCIRAAGTSSRAVPRRFAVAGRSDVGIAGEDLLTQSDAKHLLLIGALFGTTKWTPLIL